MDSEKEPKEATDGKEATSKRADKPREKITPSPLVEAFANALDGCLVPVVSAAEKRARILDLPRKFHESAIRRLMQKRPKRSHDDVDMDADDMETSQADSRKQEKIKLLEKEVQTWDLVRRLLPLRHSEAQTPTSLFDAAVRPLQASSLDIFVKADPVIKERRAVLQWLQTSAASGPDIDELARDLQQNADRGDIIAYGWLHTRSRIKLRKSVTAWPHLLDKQSPGVAASHTSSDGSPLVTHLDPDAATRQDCKLEPQDEFFERAIWLGCFEHLRRGSSLQTIQEWCRERTEMWRAISMSGLLLTADGEERLTETPPASLVLWRRMCLSLARIGGTKDHERAVYGLLSGDISSVERVAKSWDDHLFAHFNALVRSQIDTFLLGLCPPELVSQLAKEFPSMDAMQFHVGLSSVEKRLITTLESQPDIRQEALEPHKALQASLIAKDLENHLYEQARVLMDDAKEDGKSWLQPSGFLWPRAKDESVRDKVFRLKQHDGLRIVSHVCVLVALVRQQDQKEGGSIFHGLSRSDEALETIIAAYTDLLERANLKELIPLYCSVLQPPRRYEVLGWNMIKEKDAARRMSQLKMMSKVGINVLEFVEMLPRLVFEQIETAGGGDAIVAEKLFRIVVAGQTDYRIERVISPGFFAEFQVEVSMTDEQIIRSLEWLLLVEAAWPEVLRIGVKAYKLFYGDMKLLAARRLMERVQFAAILQALSDEDMDAALSDDVDFWVRHLEQSGITSAKPEQVMTDARDYRDLENLAKALDSLEDVGNRMKCLPRLLKRGDSKEKDESNDLMASTGENVWRQLGHDVKVMRERMDPLLKGWLLASIEAGDSELRKLRQRFLPEATLAMVTGLQVAGMGYSRDMLLESMDLATAIAESDSDLAKSLMEAGRMRELVNAFAACSRSLATIKGDKRASVSSSKKLREKGWSRDLWQVTI
ncbi:nuclear pore complex protein Nup107 [Ophiocordyceps camponoti-floridani]|uniref:Nuclear pore complex protein n=1 Tax=Ophiocordyceps camponoti-floridani TaxID=2030778 RepID=A0A8H4QBJ9_9HYPO|nr:nuclear pore complex protein Nup107 [Ophiocordyceps camponoti-floridani]